MIIHSLSFFLIFCLSLRMLPIILKLPTDSLSELDIFAWSTKEDECTIFLPENHCGLIGNLALLGEVVIGGLSKGDG
jgi:hypothetical protein